MIHMQYHLESVCLAVASYFIVTMMPNIREKVQAVLKKMVVPNIAHFQAHWNCTISGFSLYAVSLCMLSINHLFPIFQAKSKEMGVAQEFFTVLFIKTHHLEFNTRHIVVYENNVFDFYYNFFYCF